jgi:hypothetical protein
VTAALGVHVFTYVAGYGFEYFADALLDSYRSAPISFYAVFYGVVAGIVAVVARRA